jgi:tetratricopeptide (TPR) repeat protein
MVNLRTTKIAPDIAVGLSRSFKISNGDPWTLAAENAFAIALQEQGAFGGAENLYRDVLTELDKQKSPAFDKQRSAVLLNLGSVLEMQQRFSDAERCYRTSISLQREHGQADVALLITGLQNLASVLQIQGKAKDARLVLERLLKQLRESLGANHPITMQTCHNLARLLHDQAQYTEAQTLYDEILLSLAQTAGEQHPSTLAIKEDIAILNGDAKDYPKAIAGLQEVLDHRIKLVGAQHPETLRTQTSLGYFLQKAGHLDKAEICLRSAFKDQLETQGPKNDGTLVAMTNLATVLNCTRAFEEAENLLRQVAQIRHELHGGEHLETLLANHNLAAFLIDRTQSFPLQGHGALLEEASGLLQTTIEIAQRILPHGHAYVANFESWYGKCLAKQNQMKHAEMYAVRGYVGLGRALGYNHERTSRALDILLEIYKQMGRVGVLAP